MIVLKFQTQSVRGNTYVFLDILIEQIALRVLNNVEDQEAIGPAELTIGYSPMAENR